MIRVDFMENTKPYFQFSLFSTILSILILIMVSWIIDGYPTGTVLDTYLCFGLSTTIVLGVSVLCTFFFGYTAYIDK